MRCRYCGYEEKLAKFLGSTHCNPPFDVQPHKFDGQHPADLREAEQAKKADSCR